MVTPSRGRAAFSDITNSNNTALPPTPCDEVKRKREEKNRKQREYRARKKAEANNPYTGTFNHEANNPYTAGSINESIVISATPTQPTPISISQRRKSVRDKDRRGELSEEQRKEMNRKQREYRARKKAAPYNLYRGSAGTYSAIGQHSPYGTAYSTILQALGSSNPATPTVGYSSCNRSHGVPSDSKAAEQAKSEGYKMEMVIVGDDCALPLPRGIAGRRGLAGTILVHKGAEIVRMYKTMFGASGFRKMARTQKNKATAHHPGLLKGSPQ